MLTAFLVDPLPVVAWWCCLMIINIQIGINNCPVCFKQTFRRKITQVLTPLELPVRSPCRMQLGTCGDCFIN
jgi:hypothetical protein